MKRPGKSGQHVPQRGRPQTGRVVRIVRGQGHGYIQVKGDGPNAFFSRSDLIDVGFNDLEVGDPVTFELIDDQLSGPRGVLVRKVDGKQKGGA